MENPSALMVFCDGKDVCGGDVEVELKELCRGVMERLEGLVLVGLGPPAILPLSCRELSGRSRDKEVCGRGGARRAKRANAGLGELEGQMR